MYYLDSQRTITRRESSMLVPKRSQDDRHDYEELSTTRGQSTVRLNSESGLLSNTSRPKGPVRKEVITAFFESMLDSIVLSWNTIVPHKTEDVLPALDLRTTSEVTLLKFKKKIPGSTKTSSKSKRSRSRVYEEDIGQNEMLPNSLWSWQDERAVIHFRNGNIYEGNISMKRMNGEGRFQWTDGTVYLGQFKDNEICGKGSIQWKDDSWYQGDFLSNIRHGIGLYVDSRRQRCYAGGWFCGTKHGEGIIHFSRTFKNSYDGDWTHNVRHGFGTREYCSLSGYKGEWNRYVREGKGLMIWPNHDFYRGQWKNGVMSDYGIYIWDACYNSTMSVPSMNVYRGYWEKGQRNGYGLLNLGFGLGAHYKGEFKNNKKHGIGKLVTNNGLILKDRNLFVDDNIGSLTSEFDDADYKQSLEPFLFDICDDTIGLLFHINEAINNIDKQVEIRNGIIEEFVDNNKCLNILDNGNRKKSKLKKLSPPSDFNSEDFIIFEETSLANALKCYETDLKNIYYKYATICNTEDIYFTPILIRLYLWQMYYDCKIHDKGLTLVEIDNVYYRNRDWLAQKPYDPFEKIYFWQFLHSIISVASMLYAKKEFPGRKPDTIVANAFRTFMESDLLPGFCRRKGHLVNGYGSIMPLEAISALYRSIGEPHTIRDFLSAARRPPHDIINPQPPLMETPDDLVITGRNAFVFGDEMTFVGDDEVTLPITLTEENNVDLKLFNFGNLTTKKIINVFSQIFPQIHENNKIKTLDIEITFFEFFEAFITCVIESIRVKDEELNWRQKFCAVSTMNRNL